MSDPLRLPAHFTHVDDAVNTDFGAPLVEIALEMEVGNCIHCGASAQEASGGALMNARVENGVMRGDSVCDACMPEHLPDVDASDFFYE